MVIVKRKELSFRERILVSLVGTLVVGTSAYYGVFQTTLGMRSSAEQRLSSAEQQLDLHVSRGLDVPHSETRRSDSRRLVALG